MLRFRSLLFTCGQWLSTILFAPFCLLVFPLPFVLRYRFISQWARFNLWWLEKTCHLGCDIEGLENIPDRNGIVLCKHQSAWETLALQAVFRPQVWLLKRELLWIPFFGWGLAMLQPIAIDRASGRKALKQLREQGEQRLQAGSWVVIYPEGTRVAPGQHRKFAPGGAMLAAHSGYPVVPVAHNAGLYWPRRSFMKYPGRIRLVIGPAIDSRGRSAADINEQAEQWIEQTVERISRPESQGRLGQN